MKSTILPLIFFATLIDARTIRQNGYSVGNEISKEDFVPAHNNIQDSIGKQSHVNPTVATPAPTTIQSIMSSPIIKAMLSNITVQTVLSDPLVQNVLSNPTVQSVLTNPIVQVILTNPALQGAAMKSFLSNIYQSDVTTTTVPPPLIFATSASPVGSLNQNRRPSISIINAIISGLDEVINVLLTQNARRNQIRQKNKN